MAEHPNVSRTRHAYAAFGNGDFDTASGRSRPKDAVFHFTGEGPLSGDHKGRAAIDKALIASFELTGDPEVRHQGRLRR